MKSLYDYLNEALNESVKWEGKSGKSKFAPIKGNLKWKFSAKDYGVDEEASCGDWFVGMNEECVIFWSPKSAWMPYFYISEAKANKLNWALVGMDSSLTDPAAVLAKALEKWDDFRAEQATVPELDSIDVPSEVQKIMKSVM